MNAPSPSGLIQAPSWEELRAILGSHVDEQQRVLLQGISGHNTAGGTVTIRTLASRATLWMQLHVQTDTAGGGAWGTSWGSAWGSAWGSGGVSSETYDRNNFETSVLVDCRENRQQDHVIPRDGVRPYYVWLIPVFEHAPGEFTKYDGDDAEDHAIFLDLGV